MECKIEIKLTKDTWSTELTENPVPVMIAVGLKPIRLEFGEMLEIENDKSTNERVKSGLATQDKSLSDREAQLAKNSIEFEKKLKIIKEITLLAEGL